MLKQGCHVNIRTVKSAAVTLKCFRVIGYLNIARKLRRKEMGAGSPDIYLALVFLHNLIGMSLYTTSDFLERRSFN